MTGQPNEDFVKAILVKTNQGLRGATEDDHAEWLKFKRRLENMKPGEFLRIEANKPRSGPNHRRFFALLKLINENSEVYDTRAKALVAIKLAAGFFDPVVDPSTGEIVPSVHSINYDSMDEDEFTRFFNQAIDATINCILPQLDREKAEHLLHIIISEWA